MFTARRFRLIALAALSAFAFAQAAVAAMGCATMRVDNGRAVMPSGEPCDMLPELPGALALKHCVLDAGQTSEAAPFSFDVPALAPLAFLRVAGAVPFAARLRGLPAPRIVGPPPLFATRRLRV